MSVHQQDRMMSSDLASALAATGVKPRFNQRVIMNVDQSELIGIDRMYAERYSKAPQR
jgi:hypothetical protein